MYDIWVSTPMNIKQFRLMLTEQHIGNYYAVNKLVGAQVPPSTLFIQHTFPVGDVEKPLLWLPSYTASDVWRGVMMQHTACEACALENSLFDIIIMSIVEWYSSCQFTNL